MFYSIDIAFPTLNLRNNVLVEFLSENVLVFLSTYQTVSHSGYLEKNLLITQRRRNRGKIAKPTFSLVFENKKGIIQDSTFIPSDSTCRSR